MVCVGTDEKRYIVVWILAGFVMIVAGSFVGTVLALQYYHSGGTFTVSLDGFINRINNDKR
jgi:hypothetical protein